MTERFLTEPVAGAWHVWDTATGEVWEVATFGEACSELSRRQGLHPVTQTATVEV